MQLLSIYSRNPAPSNVSGWISINAYISSRRLDPEKAKLACPMRVPNANSISAREKR